MIFNKYAIIAIAAVLCILAFVILLRSAKHRKQKKADKEQMTQYMREEALNRAISNSMSRKYDTEPQRPIDIQYDSKPTKLPKGSKVLRLVETCKGSSVMRQYLVNTNEKAFIGEQDGHAAVFSHRTQGNRVFCEFFFIKDEIYARNSGTEGRLIRNNKSTVLVSSGILIHTGDIIETPYGSYLTEIIQS